MQLPVGWVLHHCISWRWWVHFRWEEMSCFGLLFSQFNILFWCFKRRKNLKNFLICISSVRSCTISTTDLFQGLTQNCWKRIVGMFNHSLSIKKLSSCAFYSLVPAVWLRGGPQTKTGIYWHVGICEALTSVFWRPYVEGNISSQTKPDLYKSFTRDSRIEREGELLFVFF